MQHTLLKRKSFKSQWPLKVGQKTYPANYPLCLYVHSSTGITFVRDYNGPFFWISTCEFYGLLRNAGVTPKHAAGLSGWRPLHEGSDWSQDLNSFSQPGKPVVTTLVAPILSVVTQPVTNQQTNSQLDMGKKAKATTTETTAAPAPAPAATVPPPPGAAPEVQNIPAPPVESSAPVPAPAAPVATAQPAAPAAVVEKEPSQNGVTRPSAGTTTRKVWEHADANSKPGAPAERKTVVAACVADGINTSTATTQFGKWAKFHGFVGDKSPTKVAAPAPPAAAPLPPAAVPPPPATVDPAFQAGYDAYKRAAAGEQGVVNPYGAGTTEADLFTNGWTKAHGDVQASQPVAQ